MKKKTVRINIVIFSWKFISKASYNLSIPTVFGRICKSLWVKCLDIEKDNLDEMFTPYLVQFPFFRPNLYKRLKESEGILFEDTWNEQVT